MNYARQVNQLHDQAMNLTDSAFIARKNRNMEQAQAYFRQAFELEREAALLVVEHTPQEDIASTEPTRSVLLRSAATLALDVDEIREAERLVALGLAGNPPEMIASELREVLEQITLRRDLESEDIDLTDATRQYRIGLKFGHDELETLRQMRLLASSKASPFYGMEISEIAATILKSAVKEELDNIPAS